MNKNAIIATGIVIVIILAGVLFFNEFNSDKKTDESSDGGNLVDSTGIEFESDEQVFDEIDNVIELLE